MGMRRLITNILFVCKFREPALLCAQTTGVPFSKACWIFVLLLFLKLCDVLLELIFVRILTMCALTQGKSGKNCWPAQPVFRVHVFSVAPTPFSPPFLAPPSNWTKKLWAQRSDCHFFCDIPSSHGAGCEDDSLLGYCAVYFPRSWLMFQTCFLLSPSSG